MSTVVIIKSLASVFFHALWSVFIIEMTVETLDLCLKQIIIFLQIYKLTYIII